jgi:alpha-1,2-mannosyltransferase
MSTLTAPADVAADEPPGRSGPPTNARRGPWLAVLALVAVVAFGSRLVPVLRGGGLFGLIGYDGAVYYAAGAGLAHGLLPYADFLLLHPPGVVLALLPFGLLGRVVGHPDAMAVARLAWMLLGTTSALLVAATLRRHGLVAAAVGGLVYAVWVPAIYVERTTTLEALTGVLTLLAVLLLARAARGRLGARTAFVAGLLLGASCATKIWGVVPLAAVVVWCALEHGRRRAVALALGAGVSTVAVCLPFYVAAPRAMWDMVVGAQLGRPRVDASWYTKAVDTAGLSQLTAAVGPLLVAVVLLVAASVVVALRSPLGRLATVLLVVGLALLAGSPSWSVDYASIVAAPLALLAGRTAGALSAALAPVAPLRVVALVLVLAAVAAYAGLSAPRTVFGSPFAGRTLARLVAPLGGCVAADEPTALVEADVIDRNIARGCPYVVDLGGYSYYLEPGASAQTSRARNAQWQAHVLDYLRASDAAVAVRFDATVGLSRQTRATVESWPELGRVGRYPVRRPVR